LRQACDDAGIHAAPATVESVVDAVLALPYEEEDMVLEGSIMSK